MSVTHHTVLHAPTKEKATMKGKKAVKKSKKAAGAKKAKSVLTKKNVKAY